MKEKLRVAAYCRVSTDKNDQLNSLESQKKYFTDYIKAHEGWELTEIYYDEGASGTSIKKRAGFNRMIRDAQERKMDLILTKRSADLPATRSTPSPTRACSRSSASA